MTTVSAPTEQGIIQRLILAIARQVFSIFIALAVLVVLLFAINQEQLTTEFAVGANYIIYVCIGLIVSIVGVIIFELFEIAHIKAQRARWSHFRQQLHTLSEKGPELLVLFELTQ